MSKLRVGVIGAGKLGAIHARLLAAQPDARLAGVADPDPQARQRAEQQWGVPAFGSHRDLIERMDAAIVAAPTSLHHAIGADLLERGVHVLMEKPLARTGREADQLVQAARRSGLVLHVGHVERYNPAFQAAAARAGGRAYIEAERCGPYTFRSTDVSVVLDLMVHDLDLALALVGQPPVRLDAWGVAPLGGHDDAAQAYLEFPDGSVASLSASRIALQPRRVMRIWSESGYVEVDFAARCVRAARAAPDAAEATRNAEGLSAEQREARRRRFFQDVLPVEEVQLPDANPLAEEQRRFLAAVRGEPGAGVDGPHGALVVRTADRILRSIARRRLGSPAVGPAPLRRKAG